MKKSFHIIILCIAVVLSGCSKAMLILYGVKKPDYENTAAIEKFRDDVFGRELPYLVLDFNEWMMNRPLSLPDVYVFGRDGSYIPYRDSLRPNCNGPAEVFLAELDNSKAYMYGTEFSLDDFLAKLQLPDCAGPSVQSRDSVDFHIFITWANWTGKKIYRQKTDEWLRAVRNNDRINSRIVLVNQDLQECWTSEQKHKLEK